LLRRECFYGFEAPWRFRPKSLLRMAEYPGSLHLVLNVMHPYLAEFFNKVHDIRRKFFLNLFKSE
jgi:hypothetical protein